KTVDTGQGQQKREEMLLVAKRRLPGQDTGPVTPPYSARRASRECSNPPPPVAGPRRHPGRLPARPQRLSPARPAAGTPLRPGPTTHRHYLAPRRRRRRGLPRLLLLPRRPGTPPPLARRPPVAGPAALPARRRA